MAFDTSSTTQAPIGGLERTKTAFKEEICAETRLLQGIFETESLRFYGPTKDPTEASPYTWKATDSFSTRIEKLGMCHQKNGAGLEISNRSAPYWGDRTEKGRAVTNIRDGIREVHGRRGENGGGRCATSETGGYGGRSVCNVPANGLGIESLGLKLQQTASTGASHGKVFHSRVSLKSGENAWISLEGEPSGSELNVKLISGTAEIDGHPIPVGFFRAFNSGNIDYYVHSWTGCILEISSISEAVSGYVKWIKSSAMYTKMACIVEDRVVVVDSNPSSATTLANYMFRQGQKNVCMINIDSKTNGGVVCYYTVKSTIPPHHPLEQLNGHKLMFWVGNDYLSQLDYLKTCVPSNSNVVIYMNSVSSTTEDVERVVSAFDALLVATTNERLHHTFKNLDDCGIMYVQPIIVGSTNQCAPAEQLYHSVFLQKFKTHHYDSPISCHYDKLSDSMMPLGVGCSLKNPLFGYARMVGHKQSYFYAAVFGVEEEESLMSVLGFIMIDNADRCHSVIPYNLLRKCTFMSIFPSML